MLTIRKKNILLQRMKITLANTAAAVLKCSSDYGRAAAAGGRCVPRYTFIVTTTDFISPLCCWDAHLLLLESLQVRVMACVVCV